jgi:2-keto-3-deoxy-L-rhamnonate aldolase RhmA
MTQNPDTSCLLESDETLVGGWASIPSPTTAELLATVGHDFVVVDVEHTPISLETVAKCSGRSRQRQVRPRL